MFITDYGRRSQAVKWPTQVRPFFVPFVPFVLFVLFVTKLDVGSPDD